MAQLYGSINLSKVPRELFKKVTLKDGTTATFLNIRIGKRKQPTEYGNKVVDHYISCAPKKEEQKDGVNYFIGDLTEWKEAAAVKTVSTEDINAAPMADDDDLPF